jgi:UDP-glucose 4-epimerase
VFNIFTGKGTTVRAVAQIMAGLYQTDLVADYRPARPGEVRRSIGDPHLAAEQLGFRPETTLAEGLAITLDVPNAASESKPCPLA